MSFEGRIGSINLREFKSLVERRLPHDSPLYKVIMSEKDKDNPDASLLVRNKPSCGLWPI